MLKKSLNKIFPPIEKTGQKNQRTSKKSFFHFLKEKHDLKKSEDRVLKYIPYRYYIDDSKSILYLKNGGLAKIFEIKNLDLKYSDNFDIVLDDLNKALMEIKSGIVLHYETQKIPVSREGEKISPLAPIPTMLTQNIRNHMFESGEFYDVKHYLTVSYFPDYNSEKNLEELVVFGKVKKDDFKGQKIKLLNEFEVIVGNILHRLREAVFSYELLKGDELVNFLYRTINPIVSEVKVKAPPRMIPLDELLSNSQIIYKNGTLNVAGYYTKTISIKLFAERVEPQIFNNLEKLKFPFRMTTRLIGLSKEEAVKSIKSIEKYQRGKRFNFLQIFLNAVNTGRNPAPDQGDKNRIRKSYEAIAAREELEANKVSYGYYTFSVIVGGKSIKEAESRALEIIREINKNGFTAIDDKMNAIAVYFGAMPGNVTENIRFTPMDSKALSDMLPISSTYEGNNWDYRFNAPNLFTTITDDRIFYFNNKVDKDIGHTMAFGPTGSGKSVFLNAMILNFLKYETTILDDRGKKKRVPSQVFVFDKGASSKVLTLTSGGKFYELGIEGGKGFQPLRNIHKDEDFEWAETFLMNLVEQEDEKLMKDVMNRKVITEAMTRLANGFPPEQRTITQLIRFINNNVAVKEALRTYSQEGSYGKFFDSVEPELETGTITTFELGAIDKNTKVLEPILDYIFFVLEKKKTTKNIPTLIVLDECWVFFKNPKMAAKIEEWLKVMRKNNTSVIFASQSIMDVEKSAVKDVVKESCSTQIYLANPHAASENLANFYYDFGLSYTAISELSKMQKKQDYLYNSIYGTRRFTLNLSNLELAYLGTADQDDRSKITELYEELKREIPNNEVEFFKELNKRWLKYKSNNGVISSTDYEFFKHLTNNYDLHISENMS